MKPKEHLINYGKKIWMLTKLIWQLVQWFQNCKWICQLYPHTQNNEVINDSKKEAATEIDDVTLLEQKLQQVINLPDLNDVLDGLIRWYNGVTPNEVTTVSLIHVQQRVLTNGDIIHNLLLRMLQTKKLSIKSGLLAAFFKCVYCVSTVISSFLIHQIGCK